LLAFCALVTVRLTRKRFTRQPDDEAARLNRILKQNRGYRLSGTLS
jgi:hypothetical protein